MQKLLHMRRIAARPHERTQFAVKRGQANAVLLLQDQIRQRSRNALRVLQLTQRRLGSPIAHALAGVQDEIADKIGLLLVLLQVILVGFSEDLPINLAQIIAGHVFAVLCELDRESVIRAFVDSRHVAFDNRLSAQLRP